MTNPARLRLLAIRVAEDQDSLLCSPAAQRTPETFFSLFCFSRCSKSVKKLLFSHVDPFSPSSRCSCVLSCCVVCVCGCVFVLPRAVGLALRTVCGSPIAALRSDSDQQGQSHSDQQRTATSVSVRSTIFAVRRLSQRTIAVRLNGPRIAQAAALNDPQPRSLSLAVTD